MRSMIAIVCSLVLTGAILYFFADKAQTRGRVLKILTIAFCALGLFRLLLSDGFVETVFDGEKVGESLLRWGYYISYAVLPMAVFTESRLFRNIAAYFSSVMAMLSMIFIDTTVSHFLSGEGGGFMFAPWFHYAYYILELVLALSIPFIMVAHTSHRINYKSLEEWGHIALGLPAILLQMMPAYIPQSLIGYTDIKYGSFSPFHLGWIVIIAVECVLLWFVFHNRSRQDKYNLLLFLAIAQVFHTMSIFLRGFTLSRMPIQLCSIAAFFYLFTIITRSRTTFGFCFLANIVGALIAIFLAAFDVGALSFWTLHYMYEHTFVMLMPILALAFGIFPRLSRSDLKHALVFFLIYFAFCFTSGTIINCITGKYTVNYFYMFNYSVAMDYVPFAAFTGAIELTFDTLKIYPLLILVILVVFVLLISACYGFMQGMYRISDRIRAAREKHERTGVVLHGK